MKKLLTVLFSIAIALSLTTASFAQDAAPPRRTTPRRPMQGQEGQEKAAKGDKKTDDKMKGDDKMK